MTDSTPQYQRATQEDIQWLEWWMADESEAGDHERADMLGRILNSLRATPAVPDREALARALYAASVSDEKVQPRLEAWDTSPALDVWVRDEYLEKVDRMLRVLGGFPAVLEKEPRAWECRKCGNAMEWKVTLCDRCPFESRENGTPLYAAAPQVETQTT